MKYKNNIAFYCSKISPFTVKSIDTKIDIVKIKYSY